MKLTFKLSEAGRVKVAQSKERLERGVAEQRARGARRDDIARALEQALREFEAGREAVDALDREAVQKVAGIGLQIELLEQKLPEQERAIEAAARELDGGLIQWTLVRQTECQGLIEEVAARITAALRPFYSSDAAAERAAKQTDSYQTTVRFVARPQGGTNENPDAIKAQAEIAILEMGALLEGKPPAVWFSPESKAA